MVCAVRMTSAAIAFPIVFPVESAFLRHSRRTDHMCSDAARSPRPRVARSLRSRIWMKGAGCCGGGRGEGRGRGGLIDIFKK